MKVCKVCGGKHFVKGLCRKCYGQTPEIKAYKKEYNKKLKFKKYQNEYQQKPENKAKRREYRRQPKQKLQAKKYSQLVKVKIKMKEYSEQPEIKIKIKEYQKEYRHKPENKIKRKEHNQQPEVKKRINELSIFKYYNDILFNLKKKMRTRVRNFFKLKNIRKSNKTMKIIGCAPQELRDHIEKQFTFDMNWDLVLRGEIEIDHKTPLDSAKTEEDIYRLCYYTNLQPLWKEDNRIKSNKLDWRKETPSLMVG